MVVIGGNGCHSQ